MPLTLEQTTYAILVWAVIQIARDVLSWKTRKALKKSEIKYVTEAECTAYQNACETRRREKDSDLIRLMNAMRAELEGARGDVKSLRMVIVKNMLHAKAPVEAIEAVLGAHGGGSE